LYEELAAHIVTLKRCGVEFVRWLYSEYYSLPKDDRVKILLRLNNEAEKVELIFEKGIELFGRCQIHLTSESHNLLVIVYSDQRKFSKWEDEEFFRTYFKENGDSSFLTQCDELILHLKEEIQSYLTK
jgi:hypothetical protein